ncbi:carboxylating nicotinate-nucleotide diphosphorylase [Clostridium carnis]
MNWIIVDKIIKEALLEDSPYGDITTLSILSYNTKSSADLICKEDGVLAGEAIFARVFEIIGNVSVKFNKKDGDNILSGEVIAKLTGDTNNILFGERVALNIIQRLSGIATLTNRYVEKLSNYNTKLLDTRKTTPNLRLLEKYAVKIGGGENHRFNLSDGIMIKDNHINAAGGVKEAIKKVKNNISFVRKIEIETENLQMVEDAIEEGVDIIMLDNMDICTAKKAIKIIDNKAIVEYSGNVTLENIEEIAKIGVDYISVGALTHSVNILDISLKNLKIIK